MENGIRVQQNKSAISVKNINKMPKKTKKTKKDVSLDDLAVMVQRGFLGVDKSFDSVDKKFDFLEAEMNNRFDRLEKIIFHEYRGRIEKLEDEVKELRADFRQLVGFKR